MSISKVRFVMFHMTPLIIKISQLRLHNTINFISVPFPHSNDISNFEPIDMEKISTSDVLCSMYLRDKITCIFHQPQYNAKNEQFTGVRVIMSYLYASTSANCCKRRINQRPLSKKHSYTKTVYQIFPHFVDETF